MLESDKRYIVDKLNHIRGRIGDLARFIEKQYGHNPSEIEEIDNRIDELYEMTTKLNEEVEKL